MGIASSPFLYIFVHTLVADCFLARELWSFGPDGYLRQVCHFDVSTKQLLFLHPNTMETKNTIQITPTSDNQFVSDIIQIIRNGKDKAYAAVNASMIATYWNIGRRIVLEEQKGELRAEYGTQLLKKLSIELTKEIGKGFTERNLRNFRLFYLQFPDYEIWHACVPNLTWTHFRALLSVENKDARYWYMNEAASENWSSRTLDRNVGSQYYFRLLQSQHKEPVIREMQEKTADYQKDNHEFIKNPFIAEFLGLSSNIDYTESKLESSILTHIQKFLLELGKGYAFVARQQHISTDAGDFYIDLVFYNYLLKAFLLIDLKTTKITHQDVGQMDMYVRMYDDLKRTEGDNPTIGLILCTETSKDIAKYSVLHENPQLFAAKYLTYLPSEEDLKREIEKQKEIFQIQQGEI